MGHKARRGRPQASSPEALARMKRQRQRDTKPEIAIRSELHRRGLRFRVDRKVLHGLRRKADIVFVTASVAVFVDGCFWYGCPEHATWPKANAQWWKDKIEANRRRDADTKVRLTDAGWTVLRFWTHENPLDAAEKIEKVVSSRLKGGWSNGLFGDRTLN